MKERNNTQKENSVNQTNLSFLVNSTLSDTLNTDYTKQKQFNEQFSENTNDRIEVHDVISSNSKISIENSCMNDTICSSGRNIEENEIINEEFILNNALEYLVSYFVNNKNKFFDCLLNIKIDEDKEKFEKLANIAILSKIDEEMIFKQTTNRNSNMRYIYTYMSILIMLYQYKKYEEINIDILFARAKDSNSQIRKLVIQELLSFHNKYELSILNQMYLSLYDPKENIQIIAFENIKKIMESSTSKMKILSKIEETAQKHSSSKMRNLTANFLFNFYENEKMQDKQYKILKVCDFIYINQVIKRLSKLDDKMFGAFHELLEYCTIDIFSTFSLNKKEMIKYADYLINSFKNSKKCCKKETCHLEILHGIRFNNLEKLSILLNILKDNKKNVILLMKTLNRIDKKVFVESEFTIPILDKLTFNVEYHTEELFELLLKLEKHFELYISEILPRIKHPKLITYFDTDPIDNFGVLCRGIWYIKDEKYDLIEKLTFFENQEEQLSSFTEIILFLHSEISKIENKNDVTNFQNINSAMKLLLQITVDHIKKNMKKYKKNSAFFSEFIKLLLNNILESESNLLLDSYSDLKYFLRKSKNILLITKLGFQYLMKNKQAKKIKEIIAILKLRFRNQPTVILFDNLKQFIAEKRNMHNFIPLIDIISLDERIILENLAEGEFKKQLKFKCVTIR